jgi:acetyltransferase-like isoleucine patch superfamily enzyme
MRKVSGLQVLTFLCLLALAVAVALSANYLLFGALALGDFRGVFMTATGGVLCYLTVILVFRLFCGVFPLPEGDIAAGSTAEFRYHVYLLFFLIVFYPVMFSMILPVPLMRIFYQLLGARLGPNTYPGGVVMDPPFVTIGSNTIVGQGALIVPHVIEGSRLAHRRINIGNDVTIGGRAVVLSGCSIGDGATVAIGAVVSKGTVIGAGEVWGGIPARRLAQVAVTDQPVTKVTG